MTSSHVAPDIVSPSLQEFLSQAADQAAAELTRSDPGGASEIHEQLSRLVQLGLGASDGDGVFTTGRVGQTIPPRRVIDAFRKACLRIACEEGALFSAPELAAALLAVEGATPADAQVRDSEFTRQLSSPDAINAVVEIAHDMRSPLTSILFLVETLRRGRSGAVTAVQERQLGLIYGAALGLNTLACDVIDAVRGGQRLVDGRPIPFSIAEVILGVCDTVRPISEEKALPITHLLPSIDGRIGYPGALGRVLLNLMTNALKYTNDGSVTIGATELSDTRLCFWVSDTGQGIPENVMGILFDGFRPSASGMRFSNAGLGLAICQDFLRSMGTSLQVESSPESGTRFSFEIELRQA